MFHSTSFRAPYSSFAFSTTCAACSYFPAAPSFSSCGYSSRWAEHPASSSSASTQDSTAQKAAGERRLLSTTGYAPAGATVRSRIGRLEFGAGAIDQFLDLVLADPHLLVARGVNQLQVRLVEDHFGLALA